VKSQVAASIGMALRSDVVLAETTSQGLLGIAVKLLPSSVQQSSEYIVVA
jgi:hypothetical protein